MPPDLPGIGMAFYYPHVRVTKRGFFGLTLCFLLIASTSDAVDPEVYARVQFCRTALLSLRDLRARGAIYDDDPEVVKDLVGLSREFFQRMGGTKDVEAFNKALLQVSAPGSTFDLLSLQPKTTLEVWTAFRRAGKATRLRLKLDYLKKVRGRLARVRRLTEDGQTDSNYSPYGVHPELWPLSSLDVDAGNQVVKQFLDEAARDYWEPRLSQVNQRRALEHIADVYRAFLTGRPAFVLNKEPSSTQIIFDLWVAKSVTEMVHGEGFANLQWLIEERPSFWQSRQENTDQLLTYIRMIFVSELVYPGQIESERRLPITPWLASHLTHPDRRPFGVKYASAMTLALVHHHYILSQLEKVAEMGMAAQPSSASQTDAIIQSKHPLLGLEPVLAQTLEEWRQTSPVVLGDKNIYGPHEPINLVGLITDLDTVLTQLGGDTTQKEGRMKVALVQVGLSPTSGVLEGVRDRLLKTEDVYWDQEHQLRDMLQEPPPQ